MYILVGLAFLLFSVIIYILVSRLKELKKKNQSLLQQLLNVGEKNTGHNMESLRPKLNPHLLKNALNAIQSHAYQSYYALEKLYNVLDYILYESDGSLVSLKDELDFALNLIEINRIKTSPLFNLYIKNRIDKENEYLERGLIAPFISINPIENAFKHTDFLTENSFISIIFEIKDDWFVLSVSNKTLAERAVDQKGGLGNTTFLNRLDLLYKENYVFEQTDNDGIYSIKLQIKLQLK